MALHYEKARHALEGGDRVFITYPNGKKPNEKVTYSLIRAQKNITAAAFNRLKPDLRPAGDGLFGDSLTYEMVAAE